jgi:diaminohydroxyphosphoribosylaminopyrimidine deaminase/5-amino-6-(5-phosphoribosylamino)uracil reductase
MALTLFFLTAKPSLDRTPTFLNRCIQLAWLGGTRVGLNPRVGAVVVHEGIIIGEGYHAQEGGAHAEVVAIQAVKQKELLPQSTIYVSLEPCCIFGKTPPCTDLILQMGIPRVVIGCQDPNPQVSGGGIRRLREAGVEVEMASDPQPFIDLNRPFFRNHLSQRPYITLKWAESADGFIATRNDQGQAQRTAISGYEAALLTHRLRALHQAIMVGTETVRIDNPGLNTRLYPGDSPQRVVLGKREELPDGVQILQEEKPPLLSAPSGDFQSWLQGLYQQQEIGSILVEGGSHTLQQFLDAGLYDEIYRYQAPQSLIRGVKAPRLPADISWQEVRPLAQDRLFHYQRPL